jgi:Fic family protein
MIAVAPVSLEATTVDAIAAAAAAIARLDTESAFDIAALGGLLIRSESVASSKIERLRVSQRDLARALIGAARPKSLAGRVAANVRALQRSLDVAFDAPITPATFAEIHRVLMLADDRLSAEAGVYRIEQNWIGGSDYTPRDAMFVPPKPELVVGLVDDLARFTMRTDLPAVVQAGIAHAQFETIHPFVDGNGRTGRALVHLILRRSGVAAQTVVPVSTVLLADAEGYFDGLAAYREGRLDEWLSLFASAAAYAAEAGVRLAEELREIVADWRATVRPRARSAVSVLLDALVRQPVVDINQVSQLATVDASNRHRAVRRLIDAGVLVPLTTGKRNRVFGAVDILELLERFERDVIGLRQLPSTLNSR